MIDASLVTAGTPVRPQLPTLQRGLSVVDAQALTADDARAVARALDRISDQGVLIHCEQNMLSSTLVLLLRALDRREDARRALDDVERFWLPHAKIREFPRVRLHERGVAFDAIERRHLDDAARHRSQRPTALSDQS